MSREWVFSITLFSALNNRRSCAIKIRYYTPVLATRAAYALEQQSPGETFEPYECRNCGFYHVGHSPDSDRTYWAS